MADFNPAFEQMIRNEGGYLLHQVPGDNGGLTYAGISQRAHPTWEGWKLLRDDPDNPKITALVRGLYRSNYWDRVSGDDIQDQRIAASIFDFAVNAGVRTASRLAQNVVDVTPDGIIGPVTLERLNASDGNVFTLAFALAKVARYAQIVNRDRSQAKFLLGWINRTLEGMKHV